MLPNMFFLCIEDINRCMPQITNIYHNSRYLNPTYCDLFAFLGLMSSTKGFLSQDFTIYSHFWYIAAENMGLGMRLVNWVWG